LRSFGPVVGGLVLLGGGLVVWIRTFGIVMLPVVDVWNLLLWEVGLVVGARTPSMVSFWELIVQAIQIGVFLVWTLKQSNGAFIRSIHLMHGNYVLCNCKFT